MMARISEMNRRRVRSILIAREFKQVFMSVPAWIAMLLARPFVGWLARAMFLAPDGKPHRSGEIVLAELRRIGGLDRTSIFHADPRVMAYREGRRSAVLMILEYLRLDENEVQKMMELDDGY
jgi:hypothetical protein